MNDSFRLSPIKIEIATGLNENSLGGAFISHSKDCITYLSNICGSNSIVSLLQWGGVENTVEKELGYIEWQMDG